MFAHRTLLAACLLPLATLAGASAQGGIDEIRQGFLTPPDSARPGVYWYVMDGNLSRDGITSDLESMKSAGLRRAVFLEVNVGVPRGKVDFLSDQWQELFVHMIREAERLGIEITLGTGPGWAGSGGPWVKPELSMQHLVSTTTLVKGPGKTDQKLPVPRPAAPYFGEGNFTPDLHKRWEEYYQDVAVLAYPAPGSDASLKNADKKALFYREPYTSKPGVPPNIPPASADEQFTLGIPADSVIDITSSIKPDGTLDWQVPEGEWTIMRLGARNNGAITRPAPMPGLGFEADKLSTSAMQAHLDEYTGKLLTRTGKLDEGSAGGLKRLHIDSWEMGAQNWTPDFREQFKDRRGYDPLPYFPVYSGAVITSAGISERFLWDVRQTAQELVLENHAAFVKAYAHARNMKLSIEPYDMNPTSDLELGAVADIPMSEFWSQGFGFNSAFSVIEAASIAHVNGSPVMQAEAFTADPGEGWAQYPASMKNQGDWAFAAGVNQFFYHTFAHQSLNSSLKPGMTMGPYGVHWDRSQTFWPMIAAYHDYVARCQYVLQQGKTVADILYLVPESAPHVFVPPPSALSGDAVLPDRKGYNFAGCAPSQFMKISAQDYKLIVLPQWETMTPALLRKVISLVEEGATIIGNPPLTAPGLTNYPACDAEVKQLAEKLWGSDKAPAAMAERTLGKGRIIWGGSASQRDGDSLYPGYGVAQLVLAGKAPQDFNTEAPLRYIHRTGDNWDVYFVSNTTTAPVSAECGFRVKPVSAPEVWNTLDKMQALVKPTAQGDDVTTLPLDLGPAESRFVVFNHGAPGNLDQVRQSTPVFIPDAVVSGPWEVEFDITWGGPGKVTFASLEDWTSRPEEGIRHYSGIAKYRKSFSWNPEMRASGRTLLELGEVHDIARVRINGKDCGVAWTSPWRVDVTEILVIGENTIEIEVANRWINRLIGDAALPGTGIKNHEWPAWLLQHKPQPGKRVTFTTYPFWKADSPLMPAGLKGPVRVMVENQ